MDQVLSEANVDTCMGYFCEGLRPPPNISVSEWADKHRYLTSEASGEPGLWRTARTPYLRELMDVLSPSNPVEDIAFMKGTQIGATEVGINWQLFCMDCAPGPSLIVQPILTSAQRFSKQRLQPSIDKCERLKDKVHEGKSRTGGNTTLQKDFQGGTLIIATGNSAAGLRSMPIQYLFCDEIDNYPDDVDNEGDPVDLAKKRTTNFSRRKRLYASSPTVAGMSRIEAMFNESDQRYYNVPCPYCGELQVIKWENIHWVNRDPATVYLECIHCNEHIHEYQKTWMLERGSWIAQNRGAKTAGFHLSALYSPVGWYSWEEAVRDFLKAQGKPSKLKVFVNTVLGEVWEETQTSIDGHWLRKRCEKYPAIVPAPVLCLTAAVDVQQNRLECTTIGWGKDQETWIIDHSVFRGRTDDVTTWQLLDQHLLMEWQHESGIMMNIACTCVDSGYATETVYRFTKVREWRRVFSIKGVPGSGVPIVGKASRSNKEKAILIRVGVDQAKDTLYDRLLLQADEDADYYPPGYVHFPDNLDESYFSQLTSEKRVLRHASGMPRSQWVLPAGSRNETLDCFVYNLAALRILNPNLELLARHNTPLNPQYRHTAKRSGRRVLSPGVTV